MPSHTIPVESPLKPAKPPLAIVQGKRAYAKMGAFSPDMFGHTTLELHRDKVVEITKGPVAARDCHISIADVDSAEVVTCGNPLLLLLGVVTLPVFGLGLIFLLLYFIFKHRFLVVHSSANAMVVVIKGDDKPFHDLRRTSSS